MDQKFIDEMIKAHNDYRSLHQVGESVSLDQVGESVSLHQVGESVLQSNGHYIIGPYIIIG